MRNIVGVPNGNFNNLYLNLLICTALLINQMTHTLAEIHKMHYVVTLNTPNISFHIGTEIEHLALNLCVQFFLKLSDVKPQHCLQPHLVTDHLLPHVVPG